MIIYGLQKLLELAIGICAIAFIGTIGITVFKDRKKISAARYNGFRYDAIKERKREIYLAVKLYVIAIALLILRFFPLWYEKTAL